MGRPVRRLSPMTPPPPGCRCEALPSSSFVSSNSPRPMSWEDPVPPVLSYWKGLGLIALGLVTSSAILYFLVS